MRSSPRYRTPLRPLAGVRSRLADGLCVAAERAVERGDAADAEQAATRALCACDQLEASADTSRRRLRALASLGEAHRLANRHTHAEGSLTEALELAETSFAGDAPECRRALDDLALHLTRAGRFDAAERLYRRALASRERALGPDHPAVAIDRVALATVLDRLGRADEARELLHRALGGARGAGAGASARRASSRL